jgi:Icc protein
MSLVRFLQLTDTHVVSGSAADLRPNDSLSRIVERIRGRPELDFVIVTGDLIGDDLPESYRVLRGILDPLPAPCFVIPGNHDLRRDLRRFFPPGVGDASSGNRAAPGDADAAPRGDPVYYRFRYRGHRFLALDSQIPGEVPGRIDGEQLAWVSRCVAEEPEVPTIAFVHHPPSPTGVAWLDEHRIENGEDLLATLARGNCQAVFFGHVHMEISLVARGILCASSPSTCYAFSDGIDAPKLQEYRPGFRVVEADAHGVRSHVEHL